MIALLQSILCVLKNLMLAVVAGVCEVINLAILAIAAFGQAILDPIAWEDRPTATLPIGEWSGWLAWFLPVQGILTALVSMIAAYLLFCAVKVALNWVKAL